MLDYVTIGKPSVETFLLGMFVNVVVETSPQVENNVAQIVIVMKPNRLVLKEKSYHTMQNVMDNVLKELDGFIQPVQILQHARNIGQDTCVMD